MPPHLWRSVSCQMSWTSFLWARTSEWERGPDWKGRGLHAELPRLTPSKPTPAPLRPACSPLLQLRQNQTPFERLPIIPPERLLPALLGLVRKGLPTRFRFVTHLTALAIKNHLHPFMKLVHAYGEERPWGPPSMPGGGGASHHSPSCKASALHVLMQAGSC